MQLQTVAGIKNIIFRVSSMFYLATREGFHKFGVSTNPFVTVWYELYLSFTLGSTSGKLTALQVIHS